MAPLVSIPNLFHCKSLSEGIVGRGINSKNNNNKPAYYMELKIQVGRNWRSEKTTAYQEVTR